MFSLFHYDRKYTSPVVSFDFFFYRLPIEVKTFHQSVSVNGIPCHPFDEFLLASRFFLDHALVILKIANNNTSMM